MATKLNQKSITAKTNIHFSVPAAKFKLLMDFRKARLDRLRQDQPSAELPYKDRIVEFTANQNITFTEEGEISDQGVVLSYPLSIFEEYSNQFIDGYNPIRGEIQSVTNGSTLQGIPEEIKLEIIEKMKGRSLNSPYIKIPFLEKVA